MGDIKTAADAAFRDHVIGGVASSGAHEPVKSEIRLVFETVETQIAGVSEGYVTAPTWAGLVALPGVRAGQPGRVPATDTGSHTDPVVGGSVPNSGEFVWSASPAGWRRLGDVIDAATLVAALDDRRRTDHGSLAQRVQQRIGAAAPAAGTNATGGAYALADAAEADGVVLTATVVAAVAGAIDFHVYARSATDEFTVEQTVTKSVAPGENVFDLGLPIARGQHPGWAAAAAGIVTYLTAANRGYFFGTLSGGAFTDTAAATSLEMQVGFDLAVSRPDMATEVTADGLIAGAVGKPDAPVTGSNSSPGTYVLVGPLAEDSVIDDIEFFSGVAATVEIFLAVKDGTTVTRVADLARGNTTAGALNSYAIDRIGRAGQYIAFRSTTGGWSTYVAETCPGYFYSAATTGDSVTVGAANTAVRLQIRVKTRRPERHEKHRVGLANSDRILNVGPSYAGSYYTPAGKGWVSKAAAWTDYVIENFAFSGETVGMLLDRIRSGSTGAYAPVGPRAMNCSYVLICEGWNSANHATNGVTFATWLENLRKAAETVRGMGAVPVIATEWKSVYERGAHAAVKAVADESGALFLDLVPHVQRMLGGTPYSDFWRPPYAEMHPGARTGHLIADQAARFFEGLPRPRNALKLYRRRGTDVVADIDTLMYRDAFERALKWRGLLLNQVSMSPEKYLDRLMTNSADYTVATVTQSEALLMQAGGSLALGDHALLEIVIDAEARNVAKARLTLSDSSVTVYIRDAFVSPYPTATGASVCRWAALTGSAGVFDLDAAALAGRIHGDKLSFLLVKSGGMTIKEPVFDWWGKAGKRTSPNAAPTPVSLGNELLRITSAAALSGDTWTGWDDLGGTITPSADLTYQAPYGATGWCEVDATKSLVQSLNYLPDEFEDVEAEIVVQARNFPALVDPAAAYPDAASIHSTSFDYKRVRVDLRDPDGSLALSYTGRVGLAPDEVRLRAVLPLRAGPMDMHISGPDGAVQVFSASVKPVRRTLAAHALRAETTALLARMSVQPAAARAAAYDRLIRDLIAAGVWSRLDALYVLAAHDAQAARLNWRAAAFDATVVGTMIFTAQRGYQGDGSTGYLSTGFNPTTAPSPKFIQNDAHMGLWSLTDGVFPAHDMGGGNSSAAMLATTGNFQTRGNSGLASGASSAGGTGHLSWTRSDASQVFRYRNGAAASTAAVASLAPSNYVFRLGGYITSTASFSTRQIAAAHWGSALDATQTEALYNALRRYLTGAGAL